MGDYYSYRSRKSHIGVCVWDVLSSYRRLEGESNTPRISDYGNYHKGMRRVNFGILRHVKKDHKVRYNGELSLTSGIRGKLYLRNHIFPDA